LSSSIPTAKGRRSKPAKQMGMGRWLKASISPTRSQQPHQQNVMSGLRQYGEETRTGGLSLPLFSPRDKWSHSIFGYQSLKKGVERNVFSLATVVPVVLTSKSFKIPSGESLATAKFSAVGLQISSPTFW